MTSPFDEESVKIIKKLNVKFVKIPSGEITNVPLLRSIGKLRKKIILSTGMSNLQEIKKAIQILLKSGVKKNYCTHCEPSGHIILQAEAVEQHIVWNSILCSWFYPSPNPFPAASQLRGARSSVGVHRGPYALTRISKFKIRTSNLDRLRT